MTEYSSSTIALLMVDDLAEALLWDDWLAILPRDANDGRGNSAQIF